MKKILSLCLGLCLIPLLSKAQIFVNEDFTGTTGSTPPTGWTQTTVVGDPLVDVWRFDNPGFRTLNAPISDPAAIFDSDNLSNNAQAEDVVLTTPVFDASGALIVGLVFDHYFQSGFGGAYFVEAYNGTSWDTVLTGSALSTADPQNEIIDITTSVAGVSNAQVRFRWNGDYSWFWIVDNVTIAAPVANDLGVLSIDQPVDDCGLGTMETVSVTIQNFGIAPQAAFDVSFTVDGGAPTTEAYTGTPIAPGMTGTYTFTGGADLSGPGAHDIVAYTTLIGDGIALNDTNAVVVNNLPITTIPISDDFNGYGGGTTSFLNFSNDATADLPFQVNFGGTGSGGTGPTGDAPNNGSGGYIYTEASGSVANTTSRLVSDCIDLSGTSNPNLIFSRHLFGIDIDSFKVDIDDGTTTNLLTVIGEELAANGDPWIVDTFDLSAFIGSVVTISFNGWVSDFGGDISLDNIVIKEIAPIDAGVTGVTLPASSCGLTATEQVSITVENGGTTTINGGIMASFSVDNGAFTAPEMIPDTLDPGESASYTFTATADLSANGPHDVVAAISLAGDPVAGNDTIAGSTTTIPTISTFPYYEDFEGGPAGWTSGGSGSTWAFGTPAKNTITGAASGSNAWTTGGLGTGTYAVNESSEVNSPCFDMTAAPGNSWVALNIWWNAEFSWDGAVLQSSNDGGATWTKVGAFGDPDNWYNDNSIGGAPGGQADGWSGRASTANGSGGWVTAKHPLDTATIGKSNVQFRIAFGSDGSVVDDGFAFDDFAIGVPPAVDFGTDSTGLCIGETLNAGVIDPSYTYVWSTGDTTPTITIQNMSGVDTTLKIDVTITDSLGLCGKDTIQVTVPAGVPTITAVVDNDALCNGDSTGMATAMGTGGLGILTYVWGSNPPQNTPIASNLPAGTYDVTVTDENNCSAATTVTITEPAALAAAVDSVGDVGCNGDSTGSISVSISGGTTPYSFNWDNGATTEDLTGLPAGMYTGTVTDSNGCELVAGPITVSQPDSLGVALDEITDNTCPGDSTGAISITVSGGTAPYTYMWSNGATSEDLTGLPVGSYMGTITDANGCMLVSPSLDVAATDSLPAAAFDPMPVGVDYSVDFTNNSTNATSYSWDFGDSTTSTDPSPNHVYAANGTYTVTLTATNDCGSTVLTDTIDVLQVSIEDDLLSSKISVYPNPSTNYFDVQFDRVNLADVELTLSTVDGRMVYKKDVGTVNGLYTHRIELGNNVARGIYVLRVTTNNGVVHRRLRLE